MLSVKQGGIKYHFLSLWYDAAWDWTQVSRAIGEHSTHKFNYLPKNVTQKQLIFWKKQPTKKKKKKKQYQSICLANTSIMDRMWDKVNF